MNGVGDHVEVVLAIPRGLEGLGVAIGVPRDERNKSESWTKKGENDHAKNAANDPLSDGFHFVLR